MRTNVASKSPWEDIVGYSRAVRIGGQVFVSGTTATDEQGTVIGPGDMYTQTRTILAKISDALGKVGCGLMDIVQTRMFVTDISQWEDAGRAHNEFFGIIRPATTMVEISRLIHPDMLIEIEATACVEHSDHSSVSTAP